MLIDISRFCERVDSDLYLHNRRTRESMSVSNKRAVHKFIPSPRSYKFSATRDEGDINAMASAQACRNTTRRRKADVARSHRAARTSPVEFVHISGGRPLTRASLVGFVDFMDIFMFVTSLHTECACAAILTITHAAKQTRRAAASRLIHAFC